MISKCYDTAAGRLHFQLRQVRVIPESERLAASLVVGTVRRLSAPQVLVPGPKRHAADLTVTPGSPIEYGPRTIALDARAHHDLHHGVVDVCATTTKWIAESSPLALRIASGSAIDSGMQHHLVHADKWLACPVRAQGERRRSRNLMCFARARDPHCERETL